MDEIKIKVPKRKRCRECNDWAEPSGLCPGCEAYKEHLDD